MVAFLFYIQRFFDPIRSLTMQYSVMQRAMASGERITEVLDVPVDITDKPDAVALSPRHGRLGRVQERHLRLPPEPAGAEGRVVQGEPGRDGGAGRPDRLGQDLARWRWCTASTMCGTGQVLVGGHDVRDVTQDSLGDSIAMVLQEPFLFTGTVIENIRYAQDRRDARARWSRPPRRWARTTSSCALPEGYDTKLEQRGGNLSLGQRQLISFARALVQDAKILVLDEATASIDSYTELQIQKALAVLLEGPHRPGHRPPAGDHPRRRPHHRAAERRSDRAGQPRPADEAGRALRQALQHELRQLRRHPRGADPAGAAVGTATCSALRDPVDALGVAAEQLRLLVGAGARDDRLQRLDPVGQRAVERSAPGGRSPRRRGPSRSFRSCARPPGAGRRRSSRAGRG